MRLPLSADAHPRSTWGLRLARAAVFGSLLALAVCVCTTTNGVAQTSDSTAVRGRVTNAEHAPLVDFPVLVIDAAGRAVKLRTQRGGFFTTIGLAAGPVTARLDGEGYAPLGARCRVPAGQTAYVELVAARASAVTLSPPSCRIEPPTSDLYLIE